MGKTYLNQSPVDISQVGPNVTYSFIRTLGSIFEIDLYDTRGY